MVKVREMPYSEKYAKVVSETKFEDSQTFLFIQNSLGDKAVTDLKKLHQGITKPVSEGASDKQKYETAFGNWVQTGGITFGFIRSKLGEEGIDRFIRVNVDAWKKQNMNFAVNLLSIIRFFSKGSAFSMITKNFNYEMQWFGPSTISEMSKSKLVIEIPHCIILDYPNSEDVCSIGCQKLYPLCFAELFRIRMQYKRQGKSCVDIVTPM
jgi:hypothetical protein